MAVEANILTWAGGWGLPSLDPSCLQALAYSKFAGFPTKVTLCNNPYKSPTATLPVLRLPDDIFCGCDDIIEYLKANNCDADEELSNKQKMDTLGMCCYVEDMIRPALTGDNHVPSFLCHPRPVHAMLLYMTWLVDQNYTQFTRGWYAKQLKFPYNYFVPATYFNHAKNFIAHKLNINESDVICDITEEKLNKRTASCFEVLNNILGDQEFLFGDSPTTLDSKVFSYIAIILKIPLPTNRLKCRVLEYPKLERYCDKILHLYFPTVIQDLEPENKAKEEADESKRNTINAVLSVGFAVVAMVFYALSSGVVQINYEEKDSCENCQGNTARNTAKNTNG